MPAPLLGRWSELTVENSHKLSVLRTESEEAAVLWLFSWYGLSCQTWFWGTSWNKLLTNPIASPYFVEQFGSLQVEFASHSWCGNMDSASSSTWPAYGWTHIQASCSSSSGILSLSNHGSYCNDTPTRIHLHTFSSRPWHARTCTESFRHIRRYEVYDGNLASYGHTHIHLEHDARSCR